MERLFILVFVWCSLVFAQDQQAETPKPPADPKLDLFEKFVSLEGEFLPTETAKKGKEKLDALTTKIAEAIEGKDTEDFEQLLRKIVNELFCHVELSDSNQCLVLGSFAEEKPKLDCAHTCYVVLLVMEKLQMRFPKHPLLDQLYFAATVDHMMCAIKTPEGVRYANLNVNLSKYEYLDFLSKELYLERNNLFPKEPLTPLPCRQFDLMLKADLGVIWLNQKENNKALATFNVVLEASPDDSLARCGKLLALYNLKKYDEALLFFEENIAKIWTHDEYAAVADICAEQKGNLGQAIELIELALNATVRHQDRTCGGCGRKKVSPSKGYHEALAKYAKNHAKTLLAKGQKKEAALFEQKAYYAALNAQKEKEE